MGFFSQIDFECRVLVILVPTLPLGYGDFILFFSNPQDFSPDPLLYTPISLSS